MLQDTVTLEGRIPSNVGAVVSFIVIVWVKFVDVQSVATVNTRVTIVGQLPVLVSLYVIVCANPEFDVVPPAVKNCANVIETGVSLYAKGEILVRLHPSIVLLDGPVRLTDGFTVTVT
ncbi:hypothetical protein D3C87_327260 [compost metagenome]